MNRLNLVFFSHPTFLPSQSMPRFTRMLSEGMKELGHTVEIWTPDPIFYKIPLPSGLKKWLGYIDQFLLFPIRVGYRTRKCSPNTLFVFTDNALGPWVPLVSKKPHIIHCHDFMAQHSALGKIKENPVSFTGKLYQSFIYKGYSKGKNFISVSKKTRQDLHQLLNYSPPTSEVVYNGMNQQFSNIAIDIARQTIQNTYNIKAEKGFILHVGGNQWYKNRPGVIKLYNTWRKKTQHNLPLILIGEKPDHTLISIRENSPFKNDIHFLTGVEDKYVRIAYAAATVLLFPSLAEGFGWPIAEAMVSGCPVITTSEAPMTEVGKNIAFYLARYSETNESSWLIKGANLVEKVVNLNEEERDKIVKSGIEHCRNFDSTASILQIEKIYQEVFSKNKK